MSGKLYEDGMFVSTGNPATVSETTPFAAGQLGKSVTMDNKTYVYVLRLAASGAINTTGLGVCWHDAANFVVKVATAAMPYAGVFLGDDNATDVTTRGMQVGCYGFIQTKGITTAIGGAAIGIGSAVHMVKADGKFITSLAGFTIAGQAVTDPAGDGNTFTLLLE